MLDPMFCGGNGSEKAPHKSDIRFSTRCELLSNFLNMTLIYTTPSMLRHIFARPNFLVQNPLFYTTATLDNVTFRISVSSY